MNWDMDELYMKIIALNKMCNFVVILSFGPILMLK